MDRQNMIVTAITVVVLVVAGAFVFWPDSTERATVATEQSAGEAGPGNGTTSTESSDY